jgi:hypothetical protein
MKLPSPPSTRLLVVASVMSVISAEITMAIAYRAICKDRVHDIVPSIYEICILFLLPALAGFRGYAIARKGLADFGDHELSSKIAKHFLFGIIVTYAAISLIAVRCS